MISCCRVCGKKLLPDPLFRMDHMPSAAQYFPVEGTLSEDRGIPLILHQCSGCGLVQRTGEPVPYFREVIRASAYSPAMKEFRLRQFSGWISKHHLEGKKILEPGCGRGEYLELMRSCGMDVFGTEYGVESVQFCRERHLRVEPLFFEEGTETLRDAPFDAFFLLNELEHIPSVPLFLQGIRSNLKPGAPGLIEVPNFDLIRRHDLLTEICAEHLYYFSRTTLCSTLEGNGFDVISCTPVWDDYILSAEVVTRSPLSLEGFDRKRNQIAEEVSRFLAGSNRPAVWGAGHQAMAVLAMLGLSARTIRYVVDSSPLKQGCYTFATHIPIVSPEHLETDPPDSMMVLCAGYSDEVAQQIRTRFGTSVRLAVMRPDRLEVF